LGLMLELAFEEIAPRLFARHWRLLEFLPTEVITSDEPIALWSRPGRDKTRNPLGIATADAIYFPLDHSRVLQLLGSTIEGPESRLSGSPAKLRHSNCAIASAARRWIVSHPDSASLKDVVISRHPGVRRESVAWRIADDGTYRELIRYRRD